MTVNPLTPWIEQLDKCRDNGARAGWLLRAPYSQLLSYEFTIRNRLQLARFQLGLTYLDFALRVLRDEREDGWNMTSALDGPSQHDLIAALRKLAQSHSDFDRSSPTDL